MAPYRGGRYRKTYTACYDCHQSFTTAAEKEYARTSGGRCRACRKKQHHKSYVAWKQRRGATVGPKVVRLKGMALVKEVEASKRELERRLFPPRPTGRIPDQCIYGDSVGECGRPVIQPSCAGCKYFELRPKK